MDVQVSPEEDVRELKGVRFKGVLFLREEDDDDDKPIKFQEGELLFTDYGISGIPAMQLSGDIAQMTARGEKPLLNICFTPDLGLSDINEYLDNQIDRGLTGEEMLYGILNEKQAQSYSEIPWEAWCRNSANTICENCRNFCAGCRWTREFLPIDGWIARHNVVDNRANQRLESYKILFCPEFILDAETEPLGMEKQYEVIAELLDILISKSGKFQTALNKNYRLKLSSINIVIFAMSNSRHPKRSSKNSLTNHGQNHNNYGSCNS